MTPDDRVQENGQPADRRLTILSRAESLTGALASWARLQPESVAVVDRDCQLTYQELVTAIESLADRLRARGVSPQSVVALRLSRGWRQVVAIGAVLAAGAAFVPVDPAYPESRQEYILADAAPTVAVAEAGADFDLVQVHPASPVLAPPGTAYILYTSGSTGAPKGVVVGQEHVLALLRSCFELFDVGHQDSWTLFHSYSFDFSVWEMWGCLLSGGRLVLVDYETAIDPVEFATLLAAERVTVLNLVPSTFRVAADYLAAEGVKLPLLRYLVFGGEAIDAEAINRWHRRAVAPNCSVVNMYGITETTVHVTFSLLDLPVRARAGSTPIGRPLAHLDVLLVDEHLDQVAPAAVGEMLVAGASVAYGYWRRPELTASRFITRDGLRYYRSGDRAFADEDGSLHYVGRADNQVKVRGFRVELGEVETALGEHPWLAGGACRVERGSAGSDLLAAYLVPFSADVPDRDLIAAVRSHLRGRLPAYAVPAKFRICDQLPLTPSGKVDRSALDGLSRGG
jgi:amino acid adenylation domain-containing protein